VGDIAVLRCSSQAPGFHSVGVGLELRVRSKHFVSAMNFRTRGIASLLESRVQSLLAQCQNLHLRAARRSLCVGHSTR
jgi:hypothetical protein